MHTPSLLWRERQSDSPFVESIWASHALADISRTVIADPCISIALLKDAEGARVVVMGPKTKAYTMLLPRGHTCTTIRLKPGVFLKGIPTNQLTNNLVIFPVDAKARFRLGKKSLRFPDFDQAEQLVEQLQQLGYLSYSSPDGVAAKDAGHPSARTRFRRIRRVTGLSPYQLYQLQRMHQAVRLLKQGVPAARVAMELEFVDQSHLTRASKQFLGHTPGQLPKIPQLPWL
jgi:hypothetical protein